MITPKELKLRLLQQRERVSPEIIKRLESLIDEGLQQRTFGGRCEFGKTNFSGISLTVLDLVLDRYRKAGYLIFRDTDGRVTMLLGSDDRVALTDSISGKE